MAALPKKFIRDLYVWIRDHGFNDEYKATYLSRLREALEPKRSLAPARKRREAKRLSRTEALALVRDRVMGRADGHCEACGRTDDVLQLDHFFGGSNRRALESVQTCWALCWACHRIKTRNHPSPAAWLERFVTHAEKFGYRTGVDLAQGRLSSLRIQGRAS